MAKSTIDHALVKELAALLDETGLGEIEYEAEGHRVRVAKPSGSAVALAPGVATQAVPTPAGGQAALELDAHPGAVKSPMVGTVYLSPSPDEPPFAQAGDRVTAGQTLMLVEAMKTFNEIKAPKAGSLQTILVENGQPVEYDETLAIIE